MSNIVRSYNRNCAECNSSSVFRHYETKELVCHVCGYVQEGEQPLESRRLIFQRMVEKVDVKRFAIYPLTKSRLGQKLAGTAIMTNSRFRELRSKNEFWRRTSLHLDKIYGAAKATVFNEMQDFTNFRTALTNKVAKIYKQWIVVVG